MKTIEYQIGSSSFTNRITKDFDNLVTKQLSLTIPLITSVRLENNNKNKKIYVGKEINLNRVHENDYFLKKYEIDIDELKSISSKGYNKACLLNYKKYDLVIVGIEDSSETVPDYFTLKKKINEFFE